VHIVTRFCLGVVFFLLLAGSTLAAQDSVEARVLAAEDRRFAAMIHADTAALHLLLADDLAYTHTTGSKQDKTAFLRSLGSGELRYTTIDPTERAVRLIGGDGAVVVGRSNIRVEAGGQLRVLTIRYLAVYRREANRWQLLAWQSTLLPN
jgi:ketosteroid isomerase-like protein